MSAPRERMPRAVWWFGGTSLANDFASEMIYPLLPAFVTRTLGGGALALGLLDGASEAVSAGFKLVSGKLSDRQGRRGPLMVTGYAIAALVRPLIAIAGAVWQVVALRVTDRVGKGVRTPPRDAMIADVTPARIRGRAFGLHRGADHVGAILGPLLASALLAAHFTIRQVFWLAVVPGLVAVAFAVMAVRAVGSAQAAGDAPSGAEAGGRPAEEVPGFVPFVLAVALAMVLRAPETLLILRAQDLGVGIAVVPLMWAALHVVRSAAAYPGGILADDWGARRTLAVGWVLYAVLAWDFAVAESALQAWVIFLSFGLVSGMTEGPERVLVARLTPASRRGSGYGWYHGVASIVALPGAALFGWLYQAHGAYIALVASALATASAVPMLALSGRRGRQPNSAA